jgi:hypothetical protein
MVKFLGVQSINVRLKSISEEHVSMSTSIMVCVRSLGNLQNVRSTQDPAAREQSEATVPTCSTSRCAHSGSQFLVRHLNTFGAARNKVLRYAIH